MRGWVVKVPEERTGSMCYLVIGSETNCDPILSDKVVARHIAIVADMLKRWWKTTRVEIPAFELAEVELLWKAEEWAPVATAQLPNIRVYNPDLSGEFMDFAKAPGVLRARVPAGFRWVEVTR